VQAGVERPKDPVDLRVDQPHVARMYDYYLGGKDNFPTGREAAEQAIAAVPNAPRRPPEPRLPGQGRPLPRRRGGPSGVLHRVFAISTFSFGGRHRAI
jgi:hypothetical protein